MRHAITVNVPDRGVANFDKGAFRKQIEDALRELHADRIDLGTSGFGQWISNRST